MRNGDVPSARSTRPIKLHSLCLRYIKLPRHPETKIGLGGSSDFQSRFPVRIEWQDSYKIGNAEIDAQHQEWFRKINSFLEATDIESMARCEAQMYQYTRVHFKHEETLMRTVNYPELHAHIQKHHEMLAHINTMSAQIADFTIDRSKWAAFLSDWLLDHIAKTDSRLAAFVDR